MAGIGTSPLPPPVAGDAPDGLGGEKVDEGLGGQLDSELQADMEIAEKLLNAAADGELETVKQLCALGADVDHASETEETALMLAAHEGHQAVAEYLVTHAHANVNLAFESGWTALHYAVRGGHTALCAWLVRDGGADPNRTNREGVSPLAAAQSDATKKEVADALLAAVAARKAALAAAAAAASSKGSSAAPTPKPRSAADSDAKASVPSGAAVAAVPVAAGTTTTVAGGSGDSPTNADVKHAAATAAASATAGGAAAAASGATQREQAMVAAGVAIGVKPVTVGIKAAAAPGGGAAGSSTATAATQAAAAKAGIAIGDQFAAIDEVLMQFRKLYVYTCQTYQPKTPIVPHPTLLQAIDGMIAKTKPLTTLSLRGDSPLWDNAVPRITLPQLVPLFDILGGQFAHAPFTTIDLSNNNLPPQIVPALVSFLKHTATLTALNLSNNDLDSEQGIALSRALWAQDTLLSLSLRGNPLGDKANCAFAKMLKQNRTLTELDVGHTDAATVSLVRYAVALSRANTTLTSLNLDAPLLLSTTHGSGSDETTTTHFAKMLAANTTLRHLSLAQHRMRDFGADWIAQYLAKNTRLTALDLSKNEITFTGVGVLIKALAVRPLSTTIALHANSLTDGAGCTLRLRPLDEVDELLLAHANRQPHTTGGGSGAAGAMASSSSQQQLAGSGSTGGLKVLLNADDTKQGVPAVRASPMAGGGGGGGSAAEWWRSQGLAPSDSKASMGSQRSGGGGGGGGKGGDGSGKPKTGCYVTFESKLDRHRLVAVARNPALDSAGHLPSASSVFGPVAPASSSE